MTFRAPLKKPYGVAPSPHLVGGKARDLWDGLAFITPFTNKKGAGASGILDQHGRPLAGANLVESAAFQWRGTPYGLGFGRTGTGNTLILSQTNFAPIVTSDGAGTGDFTFIMLANPIAENVIAAGFNQSVAGTNEAGFSLNFNYNQSGAATAGWLLFSLRDTANGNQGVGLAGLVDGGYHLYGARRKGTAVSVWRDGVNHKTATGTARDIYVSGTSDLAFGSNAVTGASATKDTTNIVFAAGWNEARSDDDMRLLGGDPFVMFRPTAPRKIYYLPAASLANLALWYPRIRRRRR